MKQEKMYIFIFFIAISIVQSINFIEIIHEIYPNWPIPFILLVCLPSDSPMSSFIMWYIGFATISFFVKGVIRDKIDGYGKYILVRNYNKFKFIMKSILSGTTWTIGIIIIQFLIFYIVSIFLNLKAPNIYWDNNNLEKTLPLYILTTITLVLLQMVLELFFSPVTTFLVINCYVSLSISSWSYLTFVDKGSIIIYLGIPNYMMALRTNSFLKEDFAIDQNKAFFILGILICTLTFTALRRIKKIDIY